MRRYLGLFALLLPCFSGFIANGQTPSFKAEIRLPRTVVKDDGTFSVTTVVRNIGTKEQSLTVWDCSYPDQWTTDNPLVHLDAVACKQNVSGTIPLRHGEAYKRSVALHIHLPSSQFTREEVTFRLGYGETAYFGTQDLAPKVPLFWSNAVRVIVD